MSDPHSARPERWRLFLAAPVPDVAATELWRELAPLVARFPNSRWAKRDQLHATLIFLGQTDPARVDGFIEAMQLTAVRHAPFVTKTADAGGRADDDHRGGVAWLRLDDAQRRLRYLARELDWRADTKAFVDRRPKPHVTVARRVDAAFIDELRALAPAISASWTFDRMVLYRSHPDPGGSRYEALSETLLTGEVPGS